MCIEREREREEKKVKEMALETVVFPNNLLSYGCKDYFSLGGSGGGWSYDYGLKEEEESGFVGLLRNMDQGLVDNHAFSPFSLVQNVNDECHTNSSEGTQLTEAPTATTTTTSSSSRRKRRRAKSNKNKEEVENQRMTHIVVERNRRKQMNEYLAALRSLMPASYVQRSDQASIIGGAINFVKELEQLLQSLEANKKIKEESEPKSSPFADFFAFPQYSTQNNTSNATKESMAENRSSIADIEVTMVESHANLKILSKKRPKQILKMVVGFQTLRLTILHLNVTTVEQVVLYSFSVKVEDECQLKSVDEIASAVHQMLLRIEEDAS